MDTAHDEGREDSVSKRLLHKLGSGALSAKVYRDSEWDE